MIRAQEILDITIGAAIAAASLFAAGCLIYIAWLASTQ